MKPPLDPGFVRRIRAFKNNVIVFLLLTFLGYPLLEVDIAEVLDLDRRTVHKYLLELKNMDLLVETLAGWTLKVYLAPPQLPASGWRPEPVEASGQVVDVQDDPYPEEQNLQIYGKKCNPDAHSLLTSLPASTSPHIVSKKESKQESRDRRTYFALKLLQELGVNPDVSLKIGRKNRLTVRKLVEDRAYITVEYIRYHVKRLEDRGNYTPGLLVTVLKSGDPLPGKAPQPEPEDWEDYERRKYVDGDYSDFIEH